MSCSENTVYIVCGDAVFARMLELELRDAGVNACRVDSFSEVADGALTVADSAILLSVNGSVDEDLLVEFGFSDTASVEGAVYFKRPFLVSDFLDKVRAMLCRAENEEAPTALSAKSGLIYDQRKKSFFYSGELISLTETEKQLLTLLYERRGETVSREEILRTVWGRDDESVLKTNLTDVYVRYLREKLDDRFGVKMILAIRGKGYSLKV